MILQFKQTPIIEDLRNHAPESVVELRELLVMGAPARPDPRRPGFFEVAGATSIYYIFKYPATAKVMLLAIWERDPAAERAACTCPAA